MEYVIIIGITAMVLVYFEVNRMIGNAYHRGWKAGFYDAVEIYEEANECHNDVS